VCMCVLVRACVYVRACVCERVRGHAGNVRVYVCACACVSALDCVCVPLAQR